METTTPPLGPDIARLLEKLSGLKDPLEKLNSVMDWSVFVPVLEELDKASFGKVKIPSKGSRPGYNYLLLFKMLILQQIYGLSDHQVEYQCNDRLSFKRFLGLNLFDVVPDQNTVWNFREKIKEADLEFFLFNAFTDKLRADGLMLKEGKAIDATFIEAPRQPNTSEENELIKQG